MSNDWARSGCFVVACVVLALPLSAFTEGDAPGETSEPDSTLAPSDVPLTLGFQRTIWSSILNEARDLMVFLPEDYEAQGDQRYPLLVVLDARASFSFTAAIIVSQARARVVPRMVVVGIVNTNRWRDLTPTPDLGVSGTGGSDQFLAALESEIIPYIDSHWRTSDYRVFEGHSVGGLTGLTILLERPDLFDAYILLSPSLEWGEGFMIDRSREFFQTSDELPKWIYLAIADEKLERPFYDQMIDLLNRDAPAALAWHSDIFDEEDDHMSIRVPGALAGIRWVFRDWRLTSSQICTMTNDEIARHYADATRRYKEERAPGVMQITDAAYWALYDPETVDRAMELFRLAVAKWPESSYAHSCLGEGLERTGYLEEALAEMELALKLARDSDVFDLPYFEGMVTRVSEELGR